MNRDNTVSFENLHLQIDAARWRATLAGCTVTVHQYLDGTLSLHYGPHCVGRYDSHGLPHRDPNTLASTELSRGRGTGVHPKSETRDQGASYIEWRRQCWCPDNSIPVN